MAAEKLRDLSQPIDVALLDATVAAFYGTGSKEEVRALLFSKLLFGLLGCAGKWGWGSGNLAAPSVCECVLECSMVV